MANVSIIIPALNEAGCLERTLRQLSILNPAAQEIILVDGGSQDQTVAIAEAAGIQVAHCDWASRSRQMNLGAAQATGDYLCFLHADTLVPDDLVDIIDKTLAESAIACAGLISLMTGPTQTRWGISLHNLLKTHYAPLLFRPHLYFYQGLRLLFGDQAMFCRRQDFLDCGGFNAALPIMEEADLCLRLNSYGHIRQVNRTVRSSDRRVAQWGSLKAHLTYLKIGLLWGLGVPATQLKPFYPDIR
ncbi:TIGR04283 family arsenosugar biosynthesis glycosyltransferase [Romeria aff. gracilis LEGE 07310]|uniref:4,4'-diaponeurosporenoate glycosyltransferase n=1 Tax=Vasconcelosia minhoensis LEGE 07310 TaxID=915328 RepID=A0A8J7DB97_9CYAN|nr:TIGR04283 family arsenosugar biosynthesis glycosyltransferase [Romeria gracilis]MBE9077407.1 TIGR04283 family arsenosugar biosynthesis glycosyltransferase [Romeria aff. gracilis LEGE 07310]